MAKFSADRLRNVVLIGHSGAGKTSLAEAMLYTAGVTDRQGRVEDGNTVMDWDADEIRRHVSISMALADLRWGNTKINILDTPGYFDFAGEVRAALRVVEAAILVLDAAAGVEVGTELVHGYAKAADVPVLAVLNKFDRENTNFEKAVAGLETAFGRAVVPIQVPVGAAGDFRGVVDIITHRFHAGAGRDGNEADCPVELLPTVQQWRERLIETAAEADDELTLKYLEGEELTAEEIRHGLAAAFAAGRAMPVVCAAGTRGRGVAPLLHTLVDLVPAPAQRAAMGHDVRKEQPVSCAPDADGPLAALVFKTTADPFVGRMTLLRVYSGTLRADSTVYNPLRGQKERIGSLFALRGKQQEAVADVGPGDLVMVAKLQGTATGDTLCDEVFPITLAPALMPRPVYSVAVYPKAKGDEEKIAGGLGRLAEEDPTFTIRRDPITGEAIVSGMGDLHLDVMIERLYRKFGVEAVTAIPKVAYKETIRNQARAEYKHKKQSGGHGQYGHVILELEPLFGEDQEYEFLDRIVQGRVPTQYRPAVDKGVRETMVLGVLAGYPVTRVRVSLVDGSYHDVDSSEMSFKIAASQAFKKGFMAAGPVLLEPVMNVEVTVPESVMGDIISDLNKKRGRILGMEPGADGWQVVKAQVPQAEMARFAIDLRSATQGRGTFSMSLDRYDEVPAHIAQTIIAASGRAAAD